MAYSIFCEPDPALIILRINSVLFDGQGEMVVYSEEWSSATM
jgi:hypothetical protein